MVDSFLSRHPSPQRLEHRQGSELPVDDLGQLLLTLPVRLQLRELELQEVLLGRLDGDGAPLRGECGEITFSASQCTRNTAGTSVTCKG